MAKKFCEDCRFCELNTLSPRTQSRCTHPNAELGGALVARNIGANGWCDLQRENSWPLSVLMGQCGTTARWFIPKDK